MLALNQLATVASTFWDSNQAIEFTVADSKLYPVNHLTDLCSRKYVTNAKGKTIASLSFSPRQASCNVSKMTR